MERKVTTRYKAITTKYHGPTNTRGSRVSASDADHNRVSLSWDHALNSDENHCRAARELADKMGWRGDLMGGAMANGHAFVFAPSEASE